ncbi:nicotinamide mononucleotide transporter family protein [uncultured Olleya sp.]|uniref:nicotinamide mononucleotide transporter family protein n=1 Tax=uncultured Olleya sp. TaxID=757243 RepID=UPI002598A53A|nr:nicotinamide mononucleotide transporter family protein [uncultured Olleya sp.]
MKPIQLPNPTLRRVVHSKYIDIVGVVLVTVICFYRGFHETIYYQGGIQFGIPLSSFSDYISKGAFPIGLLSTLGAVVSLLAARMIVKQQNLGNLIGVFTTVNSGIIDYLFGNHSAIITYPLTFIIAILATKKWSEGEQVKKADTKYWLLIVLAFIVSYTLVFLGFYWFGTNKNQFFKHTVAIIFGISLVGNISTAFKYEQTFLTWSFYNLAQIIKNVIQGNIANIVKYIFYIINSTLTFFDWRLNGDIKQNPNVK